MLAINSNMTNKSNDQAIVHSWKTRHKTIIGQDETTEAHHRTALYPSLSIHIGMSENRVGVDDKPIGYIHTSIMGVSEKRVYGKEK